MLNSRFIFGSLSLLCVFLLAVAFYFEFVEGLEPCPLCMAQRVAVGMVGVFSIAAFLHNPGKVGATIYGSLTLLSSSLGVFLAGRQVWLQNLPEELVPACGPGIYYMLDVFPFGEVLQTMLMGTGDCAKVLWQDPIFSLSIPTWTLLTFSAISIVSIAVLVSHYRQKKT